MSVDDDNRKALYTNHRSLLVSYAASFLGSRDDAEEVVQEVFAKLKPDSLGNVETPIAYLRTMVRNLAINRRRRRRYELEQATEHAPEWIQPLKTASPEQQTVDNDQMRLLSAALQELPEKTRVIIEMHRFDGHTLQEIANRLDMSVTSVHRTLTSAIALLTKQLNAGFK